MPAIDPGPGTTYTAVCIHGLTFGTLREAIAQQRTQDALDPFNYFSFSSCSEKRYLSAEENAATYNLTPEAYRARHGYLHPGDSIGAFESTGRPCIKAEKGGADAIHYVQKLADRLHEAGLQGFTITSSEFVNEPVSL